MSEPEKVPYIKRLENQRGVLIEALQSVLAYLEADERERTCAYKYDAAKITDAAYIHMKATIEKAKGQLGGLL